MLNQYLIAMASALFALVSLTAQAAATPFDGRWTIVAVTHDGACNGTYRLQIDVQDGGISYAGRHAVDASGRINATGLLNMTLTHDGDVIRAKGSLDTRAGSGDWVSLGCAGVWQGRKSSPRASSR
jgi:hypothetical protein